MDRDDEDLHALGKPFRVIAKLRNNRLIKAREAMGFASTSALARAIGVSHKTVGLYEGFKRSPKCKGSNGSFKAGEWTPNALRIAAALRQLPEDLWPEEVERVTETECQFEVGSDGIALLAGSETPEMKMLEDERAIQIREAMDALPAAQREIIEARFFSDSETPPGYAELGKQRDRSRTRMCQLEQQGILAMSRRLRIKGVI